MAKSTTDSIGISLSQFVDFATKTPEQQLTVVRTIRRQHEQGYDVPGDLYKQFKDCVIRMHERRQDKSVLDAMLADQSEPARVQHYPSLVTGYKRFLGRKALTWFSPLRGGWSYSELFVRTSPELGLEWNGQRRLIKLYLKQDEDLNKRRAEIVNHLMRLAMLEGDDLIIPAVLDVRKAKLHEAGKSDHEQTILLQAQARAFVELYRKL